MTPAIRMDAHFELRPRMSDGQKRPTDDASEHPCAAERLIPRKMLEFPAGSICVIKGVLICMSRKSHARRLVDTFRRNAQLAAFARTHICVSLPKRVRSQLAIEG